MNTLGTVELKNGKEVWPGCLVGSSYGQFATSEMLRIAGDLLGDAKFAELADQYGADVWETHGERDKFMSSYYDSADTAESRLNELAPDGWSFYWTDGDFFFSPIDFEEEED